MLIRMQKTKRSLLLACSLFTSGCTALMTEVDSKLPKPKVVCDASWHSQNCSPEIIARIKQDRRSHIKQTLRERSEGRVSVPLQLEATTALTPPAETH